MSGTVESDPALINAKSLVDKSIRNKGVVFSGRSAYGPIRTFDDRICEQIFTDYVAAALRIVNDGRWAEADQEARNEVIGRTALTLRNQSQGI
ncbi:MAG: hypothetical protein M3Q70_03020 [bacterium]|nr:hypothetical protein [bacterium]